MAGSGILHYFSVMADIVIGKTYRLDKPIHIFEGVIINPMSPVEVATENDDGTYNVIYMDKENMPHTMTSIKKEELVEAE